MNGTERRIEILAPFNQAIEWTRAMLFRPFNVEKWLVLGFAAFLAGWLNSGGPQLNPWSFRGWNAHYTESHFDYHDFHPQYFEPLFLTVFAVVFICIVLVALAWIWLTCRGRFIFIDCIVHNRAAIAAPWREYRREGNNLFLFMLALVIAVLAAMAVLALFMFLPLFFWRPHSNSFAWPFVAFISLFFIWIAVATLLNLLMYFMPAVMYVRRCGPVDAARAILAAMTDDPVAFVLFALFMIVLWIGWLVVGCLVNCVTCCVAAVPYVGTVLVLPVPVTFRTFSLLFLRQFGPDFDVWGGTTLPAAQSVSPVAASMPTQAPPPQAPTITPTAERTPPPIPSDRSPYEPPPGSPPPSQP